MPLQKLPARFLERVAKMIGESEIENFAAACTRPLRKSIRVNTLKISVTEFQKIAAEMGWQLTPIPWCPSGFWIDRESHEMPLGKTWLHSAGLFYIQEASSMMPPVVLSPEPGDRVLDLAAAPGSKTTQLAAKMSDSGLLLANEPATSRIKSLASNLERCGVFSATLTRRDGREYGWRVPNFFDKILLDAPCSGEGTIRKDESLIGRWSEEAILKIAQLQRQLITAAFHALAPGGELVYSTCTLAPEENEAVVDFLLREFPGSAELVALDGGNGVTEFEGAEFLPELTGTRRIWPHEPTDCEGFFVAKIRKKTETQPKKKVVKKRLHSRFCLQKRPEVAEIQAQFVRQFGVEIPVPKGLVFTRRADEIWLQPDGVEKLLAVLPLERAGLQIAKIVREKYFLTHDGAGLLARTATQRVLDLSLSQAREYLRGLDLKIENEKEEGIYLVTHRGYFLGKGLLRDGKLKNQFPRKYIQLGDV